MGAPLYLVDAFTDKAFAGNPAAVCVLEKPAETKWMQQLAAEMNQAETAFVWPEPHGYRLRWFTPKMEVELCGHATLASAHVLWQTSRLGADQAVRFLTCSGVLTAVQAREGILMDFPALPPKPCTVPPGLLEALGATGRLRHIGAVGVNQLVEADGEKTLRALQPDMRKLAGVRTLGAIVTCETTLPGVDFLSRFFAPGAGIDEDPVTGSAHCGLGPYWGGRLHKTELVGYQVSQRGGIVRVGLRGERVLLGGQAVTVLRGELV